MPSGPSSPSSREGVCSAFYSLVDLRAALNRYLQEHNHRSKPFVWTADPDRILEKVTNRPAIEARLAELARVLGLAQADFDGLLGWIVDLRRDLEIPDDLTALGVAEEHVPILAPRAAADPSAGGNPLPLDEAGYTALYRRAISGRLAA